MVETLLQRRLAFLLTATIWGASAFSSPSLVKAETPLTRAVVQSVKNTVRLILRSQPPRPARVKDAMAPGDALSTARLSLAELRFNDGSLARVGEQALFQFLPNTRTFRLNNGTALLLIPPGRGQTRLQTPNAVAGIRGSALFIRYVPETDTTVIGALTTSGIEVTNRDRTQSQPLAAGQMAVIIQNRIERVYNFDLRTFYETSDIVRGLSLLRREPGKTADPAIAAVQEETSAAVNAQAPIAGSSTIQNPSFLKSPTQTAETKAPTEGLNTVPSLLNPSVSSSPSPIDLTILQPATVSQPTAFPSVGGILQPGGTPTPGETGSSGQGGGNIPGAIGSDAPGRSGAAPGQTGNTPRQNGSGPPGQTGAAPGQVGNTPGQNGSGPPGQTGAAPGQVGNTPGQNGNGPPGQTGAAPGQVGTPPGQNVVGPPGQTGTAPGLAGTTPGQGGGGPPGQTGTAPGLAGTNPGQRGNNATGQTTAPGQSTATPATR